MNKFAIRFYILLLIWSAWFWYVWYLSSNSLDTIESIEQNSTNLTANTNIEESQDSKEDTNKEKDYHIWDEEFWDKAQKIACMDNYDSDIKYMCKHEIEKIEFIAHWVEVSWDEITYHISFRAPSGNSLRYYNATLHEDLHETWASSWWESMSQEAVAVKDCWEDKIYKYVYSHGITYKYELEEIDAEEVILKYEENWQVIERKYIFERRWNEILEKSSDSFIDENRAIKIISEDCGVDEDIIKNADEDTWMYLMMFNWLDTQNQIYHYQFTDKWYTYKYELDAISWKIITKNVEKDIWEKWALDIAMKEAWLTEDSFWRPADWYMRSLVMPDIEKETLSWQMLYKVSIAANDDKVYYYEISWSEWKITKSTITESFTIDKKSWTNNDLMYTISPEDQKSSKRTINLYELWMEDIYEFKDKIYLKIQYKWEKVIDWSIIDENSRRSLWKLTKNDLNELYNFESNHKIIDAGSITWWDILLSTLTENVIYKYTIPEWSYCEPKVINDLWIDCIIYEKENESTEKKWISYRSTPLTNFYYPRWYPGQWKSCSYSRGQSYYLLYKRASTEDLFKVIPPDQILNLDKYKVWDKLTRDNWREYNIDYLYNNTQDDITFFIKRDDEMTVTIPPKTFLFCSDSVDTVILTKKWAESKRMTKDEIINFVILNRELDTESIDKNSIKIKLFRDLSNNKKIYEVSMRSTKENQLYISYVDIENFYITMDEKALFGVLAEEPWLSFKIINDSIKTYWLDNSDINHFICNIESDWLFYEYTIDIKNLEIISRKTINTWWELVTYWPNNIIYPLIELNPHGSVYLSDLKENTLYKINMDAEDVWNLYNRLGYSVLLTEKTVRIWDSNYNKRSDYETRILQDWVWLWIWWSPTYDEEIYVLYKKPTTEELVEFIWEENIIYLSKHEKGEKFDVKSYSDYIFNDTDKSQGIVVKYKAYDMSDAQEHRHEKLVFVKPWEPYNVSNAVSVEISPTR